ncbi:MAG: VWA domain-containing protein [Acidobacteriota bacterium]
MPSTAVQMGEPALEGRKGWTDNSSWLSSTIPFAAVVHHPFAEALLLAAIEPGLKGVLIASNPGTGKTTLARSFLDFWHRHLSIPHSRSPVTVTAATSEEALIGGLNLELSLKTSMLHWQPGLLSLAHQGWMLVDDLHLLPARILTAIVSAIDSGVMVVERDGFSKTEASDFSVLATYCDTTVPPRLLTERLGLIVTSDSSPSVAARFHFSQKALLFDLSPAEMGEAYRRSTQALVQQIRRAQQTLPEVRITRDQLQHLSTAALELGIEGHRAEIFAAKAARARAAWEGRLKVEEADLLRSIHLTLIPRSAVSPDSLAADIKSGTEQEEALKSVENRTLTDPECDPAVENESANSRSQRLASTQGSQRRRNKTDSQIKSWTCAPVAVDLPKLPWTRQTPVLARKQVMGSHPKRGEGAGRGRQVRSLDQPGPSKAIAVVDTLRAAALRGSTRSSPSHTRSGFGGKGLLVHPSDLRFKQFQRRCGLLFIFAVDASGSMAMNRMAEAKGALLALLRQAYLFRDQVALIRFGGDTAQTLLHPTRSVVRASRLIESLPAAGPTPLAAALVEALRLHRLCRLSSRQSAVLLLFTDGRANRGLSANPPISGHSRDVITQELEQLGGRLKRESLPCTVIDTQPSFAGGNASLRLAGWLGAQYIRLPRPSSAALCREIGRSVLPLRTSASHRHL